MNRCSIFKAFKVIGKVVLYLLVSFAVLIVMLIIMSIQRRYSYKITDVYMQRIYIDNETSLANKTLYLVGAKTQKDRYELKNGFLVNWKLYYSKSSDSICDVSIENAQGTRLNNKFTLIPEAGFGRDGFLLTNGYDTLWAHSGEQAVNFVKIKYLRTRRIEPNSKVLIVLEDTIETPETIKVIFHDKIMKKPITNIPVHYTRIKPESDDWPCNWPKYYHDPEK